MGYLKILAVIALVYLAHSYYLTSPSNVRKFIEQHELLSMKNVNEACDNYTDDMEVSLYMDEPDRYWEVEGGKDEMCGFLQKGQAALVLSEGSVTTSFHDMNIVRGGFPFTKATATYTQMAEVNMDGQTMRGIKVKLTSKTHDKIELKRTFTGLKISKVEAKGKVQFALK